MSKELRILPYREEHYCISITGRPNKLKIIASVKPATRYIDRSTNFIQRSLQHTILIKARCVVDRCLPILQMRRLAPHGVSNNTRTIALCLEEEQSILQ